MKKSILLTILISQLMISCDKKKDIIFSKTEKIIDDSSTISTINNNQTNTKSAKTTLDWVGTYEGILPCSNCAGIKTTVTLNKDESIKITSQYLKQNKKIEKIENEGYIKWTADNNALYLDTKDKNRFFYKVEENKLIVLTQEGEEMKSALSNKYILNKK